MVDSHPNAINGPTSCVGSDSSACSSPQDVSTVRARSAGGAHIVLNCGCLCSLQTSQSRGYVRRFSRH